MNRNAGRDAPVLAFVFGAVFLLVGWYHVEDRVIAPLRLSEARADQLSAALVRIVDTPDWRRWSSRGGEIVAGQHVLHFDGFGPVEYPRDLASTIRQLRIGEVYDVEVQPWGTGYWRAIRDWIPFDLAKILNYEIRSAPGHRMLISLRRGEDVLITPAPAISAARGGLIAGVGIALFYGGIGTLIIVGRLAMLGYRR